MYRDHIKHHLEIPSLLTTEEQKYIDLISPHITQIRYIIYYYKYVILFDLWDGVLIIIIVFEYTWNNTLYVIRFNNKYVID